MNAHELEPQTIDRELNRSRRIFSPRGESRKKPSSFTFLLHLVGRQYRTKQAGTIASPIERLPGTIHLALRACIAASLTFLPATLKGDHALSLSFGTNVISEAQVIGATHAT